MTTEQRRLMARVWALGDSAVRFALLWMACSDSPAERAAVKAAIRVAEALAAIALALEGNPQQ